MGAPLSLRERLAMGRAQRKHMRRIDHAGWSPKARRVDPLGLLADSDRERLPAVVRLKHERMAASAFGFFRGALPVMAADLALGGNSGIFTQLCGDAHVRNLGAFAAPDGRLVFDINDFDETIHGPFEWDVKRMAASIIVAGLDAGGKHSQCRGAVRGFLAQYRTAMHTFARMPVVELARYQVHRLHTIQPITQILRLAERATPLHSLEALTVQAKTPAANHGSSGMKRHRIFRTIEPTLRRVDSGEARRVLDSLATYAETLQPERRHFLAQYTPVDVAFKVVGTGSVGLRDYCVYLQGNGPADPLFLQIKQEVHSAYTPYLGDAPLPVHQGRRVVEGQRAMQLQSDPFLGWTSMDGCDYLVRQLNDHKAGIDLSVLRSELFGYAAVCGETLARGHARAGDSGIIAGYIGTSERFDEAIVNFADAYLKQTTRDWQTLMNAKHSAPEPDAAPAAVHSRRKRATREGPRKKR
jgi:uncharacterized protein (DUF2252 family)